MLLAVDHGPLTRYVKLQVAHAPGMPGAFSPAADFKGNRELAIPACITARAWGTCRDACRDRLPVVAEKTFPAFPAHAHPQFYVSGKRPIRLCYCDVTQEDAVTLFWPIVSQTSLKIECVINNIMAGHAIVVVKDITLLFYHGNAVILTLW